MLGGIAVLGFIIIADVGKKPSQGEEEINQTPAKSRTPSPGIGIYGRTLARLVFTARQLANSMAWRHSNRAIKISNQHHFHCQSPSPLMLAFPNKLYLGDWTARGLSHAIGAINL